VAFDSLPLETRQVAVPEFLPGSEFDPL